MNWIRRIPFALVAGLTLLVGVSFAQDRAIYKTKKVGEKERRYLSMDFSRVKKPGSLEQFKQVFHLPPVRQDTTGTCWAFATTSFLESELRRLGKEPVKLSEMFVVYHEYIEKARRFIRERGNSFFGQGSEANAVIERVKQYGIVPRSAYDGLPPGRTTYNHSALFKELKSYLNYIKQNDYWDEEKALAYIRQILNKHMGEPPKTITVNGRQMTPLQYAREVLQLPLESYISVISFKYAPFYTKAEYTVPDNWWHSKEYYNVPLDEFYRGLKNAIRRGYSVVLAADVSEPGKSGENDIAIVPTYDVLPRNINQDSREFRFYNHTSTDDHAIHLVGYTRLGGHDWFLVKDSGRSSRYGKFKGYYFFRDDYVRLKVLAYLVHKEAIPEIMRKFKERQEEEKAK